MNARRIRKAGWLVGVSTLAFLVGGPLYGQEPSDKPVVSGSVEVGFRQLGGNRDSSKFEEYRDIPSGVFVRYFRFSADDLFRKNFFIHFQTRESLEKDQTYLLDLGVPGKYQFEFRWDQTPHLFTTSAQSLFLQSSPGVFTIADPVQAILQAAATSVPRTTTTVVPALFASEQPFGVSLRRDTGSVKFVYMPTPDWDVRFQYARERQTGARPFGTTTNAFTNVIELPEPIDYRTHLLQAGTEYSNKQGGFQASYTGSFFQNQVDELVWDNPFRVTDGVNNSSRGRLDLYPDNSAHSLNFAGAFNINDSTRFMASVVPGWMRQNDPFLPFTINTAITGAPSLPATSLDGKKQTLAMNYTVTSSAIPSLGLTARLRSYDYNNNTRSLIFDAYVRTDGSLQATPRRSLPYQYDRLNFDLSTSWELPKGSSLKLLYEWERFDREHRDIERSNEHTVGFTFDTSPNNWFLFRASYKYSNRVPEEYEPNEESFPLGDPGLGQFHELRKFDQAARRRHRAETLLQITPADALVFSAFYGTTQNDYKDSEYGLLKDLNYNFGFDLTYSPRPEFSIFAEYTRERDKYSQLSRQRSATNDNPNNDWASDSRDLIDTWGAGINASLLENRLIFDGFYGLSVAKGLILTQAEGDPTLAGFVVTTATNYPTTGNRFHQAYATLKIPLAHQLTPKFEYRYERYGRADFQIDRIAPFMAPIDAGADRSIFLGAGVTPYNAHIFSATLEYIF